MTLKSQARHPFELVGIFLGLRRVAIGQIEASHPKHTLLQRDHAFEKSRVDVLVVAGKPRLGLIKGQLRQQRNAVEGLLAVGDDIVAERLDLQPRKRLIDAFDFLQAHDVRRAVLQPAQQMVDPLPDRIDVPGGDAHRE
jgi:hypothetical protein